MLDDYEEVPYYSSSSSSVGSIPWADDAIKQNQLDWERVEHMIAGDEEALPEESELLNEIAEWRRKFPTLIEKKPAMMMKQQSFNSSITNLNSTEMDNASISSLSLSSLEDYKDEDYADFDTPTNGKTNNFYQRPHLQQSNKKVHQIETDELSGIFNRGLYISSVPIRSRESQDKTNRTKVYMGQQFQNNDFNVSDSSLSASSSSAYSFAPKIQRTSPLYPKSPSAKYSATSKTSRSSVHMPPILNILETKRSSRALANNQSFVPLSRIQYVKSAAVRQQKSQTRPTKQTSWPLAPNTNINYYSTNKRNAIILPAINLERINEQTIATNNVTSVPKRTSGEQHNLANSSQSSSGTLATRRNGKFVNQWNLNSGLTAKTHTTTGRSISALNHSRLDYNTIYLPYSASKFKTFK